MPKISSGANGVWLACLASEMRSRPAGQANPGFGRRRGRCQPLLRRLDPAWAELDPDRRGAEMGGVVPVVVLGLSPGNLSFIDAACIGSGARLYPVAEPGREAEPRRAEPNGGPGLGADCLAGVLLRDGPPGSPPRQRRLRCARALRCAAGFVDSLDRSL